MGDAAAALALLNQKFPVADVVAGIKCERAIKWELTIGDDLTPHWKHSIVCVSIEKTPFAQGSCRTAHKLQDWSKPDQRLVGKFSTNKKTTRDSYFTDVLMQTFCAKWTEKFNEMKPPKPITFLPSYVYELIDHPPPYPVCGGEPFIDGEYKKHNNNSGYVSSDARNTPQAFSHFSFEHSNHELLIVDIQGVNDFYTDPQIHTKSAQGFGEGNLGETGFHKFLQTHKCNAVCDFLKLKQINQSKKTLLRGTLPVVQLMEFHDAIGINANGQATGAAKSGHTMEYFASGQSTAPASLEDEEKMLQEQLERIRAQQKAKQAALPKQPSNSNLHKLSPKPAPKPAAASISVSASASSPPSTSPTPTSPKPVPSAVAKPVAVAATPVAATPAPVAVAATPAPVAVAVAPSQPTTLPTPVTPAAATAPQASNQEIVPDKSAFEKWDLKNIRNQDTIRGLQSECIVGDDTRLYTGSNDGNLGVWDINELKHTTNIRAHGKSIRSVCMTPTGHLITGGADSYLKQWDLTTMTAVKEIKEANEVNTVFVLDNLLFTGCNDKTVKVWDLRSDKCLQTLQGHTRAIKTVYAMGNLLFSGSNDQQIFVWSLQNNRILTNFQGHEGWVKSLYAHNNTLYSGSHDETVKVWDLKTTKCVNTIKCKDRVETLHVTNQGIFAGAGDFLQVFSTTDHEQLAAVNTRSSILCTWRRQNQLFTGSLASNLKVWNWDLL
ncbi:myosin heavy chain kinase [Cavenderia fasciculata]|uniref:Myosin heavy chain kinase n=1 Tax=Cavenderia fasciculata TaxID=261658 RepID=F4Q8T8_CACFS|nr:myosin heavy chain kinase [Cavenderia fasciculata]EGG15107.1 myosin heavy chain kinase [Cavenderia fasciculata]|eukprot:XP_004351827.1 myosin heavy chain kinase [Cavenderia fasciculata]